MESVCRKCNLPIHTETLRQHGIGHSPHTEWLHDKYLEAWRVVDGYAHALHFAEPKEG
jgi:hypothetical protein